MSGGADATVRIWDVQGNGAGGNTALLGGPGDAAATATTGEGQTAGAGATTTTTAAAATATNAASDATAMGKKKKTKTRDETVSADQMGAFPTKKSPVYKVEFTDMNLVLAGGAYLP